MADRRMISASVVGSDSFIELSYQAQALYIQLVLECDSYGFCSSVKKVMRYIGVTDDTLKELEDAFFVIRFDTGVYVIRHWFTQNYGGEMSKNDRWTRTEFVRELSQLTADYDGAYVWKESERNPMDSKWSTNIRVNVRSKSMSRAMEYISKGLAGTSSSSESSSEDTRARARETDGDEQQQEPEQIVFTSRTTGKAYTLKEYIDDTMKRGCVWRFNDVTWKIVDAFRRAGLEDRLIRMAFDKTVDAQPLNEDAYFTTVLKDYKDAGFTTEAQALERERSRA